MNLLSDYKITKITFLLLFVFINLSVFSQNRTRYQADYDAKTVKFGYILGFPMNNYYIRYNQQFIDDYYGNGVTDLGKREMITSPTKVGLRMGGVINFRIDDYFDFRIIPSVSIYRYELNFLKPVTSQSGSTQTVVSGYTLRTGYRENAWFELPFMVKYKSERRGNMRMYVFAGTTLGFESNAINRTRRGTDFFKITDLRTLDASVNYGVGLEMFREYFKFAPELHFSHGMRNLVDAYRVQGTDYAKIDKLATHTVSLNFLFE